MVHIKFSHIIWALNRQMYFECQNLLSMLLKQINEHSNVTFVWALVTIHTNQVAVVIC